jgi:hypothetical protein
LATKFIIRDDRSCGHKFTVGLYGIVRVKTARHHIGKSHRRLEVNGRALQLRAWFRVRAAIGN